MREAEAFEQRIGRRPVLDPAHAQPEQDVVADAAVQHERPLEDRRDAACERQGHRVRHGRPINVDGALRRPFEALQQPEQRALAGAARADDAERLAARDREVRDAQHGPRAVAMTDAGQLEGGRMGGAHLARP